jgi:hypothetical protein
MSEKGEKKYNEWRSKMGQDTLAIIKKLQNVQEKS